MVAERTLYLHVGMGKTGTSHVQAALASNYDRLLASYGVLYPKTLRMNGDNHHLIPPILSEDKIWTYVAKADGCGKDLFSDYRGEVSRLGPKTIIISHESFFFFPEPRIAELKEAVLIDGYQTKIVIDLRKQEDYYNSALNEWIKASSIFVSFEKLWRDIEYPNVQDYYAICIRWAKFFGLENIIIRPYERSQFLGGEIKNDFFLRTIGKLVSLEEPTSRVSQNPSLSTSALEIKRIINFLYNENPTHANKFLDALFRFDLEGNQPKNTEILGIQRRKRIAAASKPINENISRVFGEVPHSGLLAELFVEERQMVDNDTGHFKGLETHDLENFSRILLESDAKQYRELCQKVKEIEIGLEDFSLRNFVDFFA